MITRFRIRVVADADIDYIWIADMLSRIKQSAETGQKLVMILPNPVPLYRQLARLINACRIDCKNLWAFAMDEYADENGTIAPEEWEFGFTHSMMKYLYYEIDEKLRPPSSQFVGFTNKNVNDYSKIIADQGGANICYSGPGWTGHLAFIEPDAPEFQGSLEEWKNMEARICTLSPFTIAQNSLHAVSEKRESGGGASTGSHHRTCRCNPCKTPFRYPCDLSTWHHYSWQRFISRLVLHGPVTPRVPESILQTLRTDVFVSETIAQNIEPDWNKGY